MDFAKCISSSSDLLFLLIFLSLSFSFAADNAANETFIIIKDGNFLFSNNKNFTLGFFTFNSSTPRYVGIWYTNIPKLTLVWVANRNQPLQDNSGTLAIDHRGNIVIYSLRQNISLWSINVPISTINDMSVQLLDTGNLVVMQKIILWQSFDYPSHTMLPYMKIGLNRKTGFSWSLTSWKAEDDPGTGNFTCRIDPTGYPQLVVDKGNVPLWRGGPWTGFRWTGIPEMQRSFLLNVNASYVDNSDEVSITDGFGESKNPVQLMRMVLDESGLLHRSKWEEEGQKWTELWAPTELCDGYNSCGPNSNCDPYILDQFQCQCLPGFELKAVRDWAGGCVRIKERSTCRSGEGFVVVPRVKVPDTRTARGNRSMNLEACGEACLKDCNCTAYTSEDEKTGMGCIMWYGELIDTRTYPNTGQDLHLRVDAVVLAQYANHSNHRSKKKVVAAIVVSGIAALLVVASLFHFWKKKRKRREKHERLDHFGNSINSKEIDGNDRTSDLPAFDLSTITKATDNFSSYNELGKGGFGSVYKGKLKSGVDIAVKRLAKNSGQGAGEFRNEVTLIAKLQHRNLVRIIGYCVQHEEKMLVYEFLPNKSLDSFIFDECKKTLLDWTKRFEIICGIARGILYLHQDSRLKIIHRDLKASNVLLDADLNPKISDFGMARIFGEDQIQENTNRIVGTFGYMSPEYAMGGLFSMKSDVYSFGVLLLEIVTGRKNINYGNNCSYLSLVGHIWELWKINKAMELIDSKLDGSCNANEIMRCIQIGLLCVQEDPTDRPTMSTVVFTLGNEVVLPPPNKPAFISKRRFNNGDPSTSTEGANSVNDVTVTVIEAR